MIVLNDVRMLLTYGVSPAGAEQSALGQPVTNPADRIIVEKLKAVIQQSSDAAIVRQRFAEPQIQSMRLASAKQRAECAALFESVKRQSTKTYVISTHLMLAKGKLGLLERSPAQPSDARFESWKAECNRLKNEIASLSYELQRERNTEGGLRGIYNAKCGGHLPQVSS